MASVNQLIFEQYRMSEAEHADLLRLGYKPEVVQFLRDRGFREAGMIKNADGSQTRTFLRQHRCPYLHIRLDPGSDLCDVIDAIADASYIDGADAIVMKWQRFQEAIRNPRRPREIERNHEQRLRELEEKISQTEH